jgi:hypothetical protein
MGFNESLSLFLFQVVIPLALVVIALFIVGLILLYVIVWLLLYCLSLLLDKLEDGIYKHGRQVYSRVYEHCWGLHLKYKQGDILPSSGCRPVCIGVLKMKVSLRFEVQDRMGRTIRLFWKDIDMPAAPHEGLTIGDDGMTFTLNRQPIYSIKDGSYYVTIVEYAEEGSEEARAFTDTLTNLNWERHR